MHPTPYAISFRMRFFAYHNAMRHFHTDIILSLFSIPKMCRKHFENRFTNKNLASKNVFEYRFCIGKGDNPNILNFGFWQICRLFKHLDPW